MYENFKELLRLERIKHVTSFSKIKLLEKYYTAELSRQISDEELCIMGVSRNGIANLRSAVFSDDIFNIQVEKLISFDNKVKLITVLDKDYPSNLKNIYDPPPYLFYEGTLSASDDVSIAVVGSRSLSRSGIYTVKKLSRELALTGFVIVSGLAMGADTVAHMGALEVNKRTVSVLGSGIDQDVSVSSRSTRRKIIEGGGAVYSPFLIGTEPAKYTFPARNRIISGISLGVVIGEAKSDSGSLITANFALEQGKEVFAVPNEIFNPKYEGGNNLIKTGQAKLITCAEDVTDEFPDRIRNLLSVEFKRIDEAQKFSFSDETEEKIYNLLMEKKMNIDEISEETGVDTGTLMGKLFLLEMNKMINREPNNYFSISRK
ncbi:TPA: DNA-protecting protein DprA [Candidatus Delongbacteria bacterium]|nr:MAG: DNA protecting protein DprA [Candidatus Delongbacteria bacterium GWF2_40_14]HAQ61005.1 DNA-protecting protein DprA [Candidatus Delongbacteria bacterium]